MCLISQNPCKCRIWVLRPSEYRNAATKRSPDITRTSQPQNPARDANCKQEFLDLVEGDWTRLCYRTSQHNILDQRYIVRWKPRSKFMSELDEVGASSEDDCNKIDDKQSKMADNDDLCLLMPRKSWWRDITSSGANFSWSRSCKEIEKEIGCRQPTRRLCKFA